MSHPSTISCSRCGKIFTYVPLFMGGKEILRARVLCEDCAADAESEFTRAKLEQERQERLQRWH